jgi:hypothetical protein
MNVSPTQRRSYFVQTPERSNAMMQMMAARVIAATVNRLLQLMPRLTHHSSAQPMMTGAMISSCKEQPFLMWRLAPGRRENQASARRRRLARNMRLCLPPTRAVPFIVPAVSVKVPETPMLTSPPPNSGLTSRERVC